MSTALAIRRTRRVIPGFGITLGVSILWLSLIILIPLAAIFLKTAELSFSQFAGIITSRRVLHALQLSFGLSLAAAPGTAAAGGVVAILVSGAGAGRGMKNSAVPVAMTRAAAMASQAT